MCAAPARSSAPAAHFPPGPALSPPVPSASFSSPPPRAPPGVLNTITARLDNATDRLYFNHLNYLKDVLPEIGRTFKVVYSMGF